MGQKSRARRARRREPHPTIFVLEGAIQHFPDSMLELNNQITADEWDTVVRDTIQYKIFLDCLKEVACPILKESWTKEDDWYRVMLDHNVGRMRNIDPILVASIDQDKIRKAFEDKIRHNALDVAEDIKTWRDQQQTWLKDQDHSRTDVSEL